MMKELEDYSWFPQRFRKMQMDFIGWVVITFHLYRNIPEIIDQTILQSGATQIVDLCGGSGLPTVYVANRLKSRLESIIVTDLYPQEPDYSHPDIEFDAQSIDATKYASTKQQVLTMYNAFHHFDTTAQAAIIQNIQQNRSSFIFVEILEPTVWVFLKILFTTIIGQLVTAPFVQPFSFLRLLFTYLIPINLLTVSYDGIISVLKSKSLQAYQELLAGWSIKGYELEAFYVAAPMSNRLIVLKGRPL